MSVFCTSVAGTGFYFDNEMCKKVVASSNENLHDDMSSMIDHFLDGTKHCSYSEFGDAYRDEGIRYVLLTKFVLHKDMERGKQFVEEVNRLFGTNKTFDDIEFIKEILVW